MNYLPMRDDLKAKLETVAGIGIVHGYERQTASAAKFIELFSTVGADGKKRILGCEITRGGISEHQRGAFFGHNVFVIHLYMGIEDADATDEKFQVLIDAVRDKFRKADPADSQAPFDYRDGDNANNSPVQVPVIDGRVFGNVLCHHAEIHISMTERTL